MYLQLNPALVFSSMLLLSSSIMANQPAKTLWLESSSADTWQVNTHAIQQYIDGYKPIPLPNVQGQMQPYQMRSAPVMSQALSAKFPHIKSYTLHDGKNQGYIVFAHGKVSGAYQTNGQWRDITQVNNEVKFTATFDNQLEARQALRRIESFREELQFQAKSLANVTHDPIGDTLTTYRLAVTASGEYSTFSGGTVDSTIAAINTLFVRVNQIVERDLAIRFELIDDNDQLIFLDANTDPFTNDDAGEDIDTNQTETDTIIGNPNYDIGHLLNTNGGGLAGLGALCATGFKATAYTGSGNPSGERFIVDLLLHEIGHQLGGRHSFNANESSCADGNRSSNGIASVEVGSGTTIMGYAGICASQNVERISSSHYHAWSLDEMRSRIQSRSCGTETAKSNTAPSITLSQNSYEIPANTPFMLNASVTDAEQSGLLHIWEQVNPGGTTGETDNAQEAMADNGNNPLFRSFEPVAETHRYFPELDSIVSGNIPLGEVMPSTSRELTFRITTRDLDSGVVGEEVTVNVTATSNAFALTSQTTDDTWQGASTQTITWQTGDTELAPINCANVDLSIDSNGDSLFDLTIASNLANTGSADITVPSISIDNARLMLKCADNVFFNLSQGRVSFVSSNAVMPIITGLVADISTLEDTSFSLELSDLVVIDSDSQFPGDFTLEILDGVNYVVNGTTITPTADFNGSLSVQVRVNDGVLNSNTFSASVTVTAVNDTPTINSQSVITIDEDTSVTLTSNDVSLSDPDNELDELQLNIESGSNYSFSGLTVTPNANINGTLIVNLSVSDGTDTSGTFPLTIDITPINDEPVAVNDSESVAQDSGASLFNVLANDTDADLATGDELTITNVNYTGQGTVSIVMNQISYQPASGFSGNESLTYTISDSNNVLSTATLNINVTSAPVAPPPTSDSGGGSMPLWLLAGLSLIGLMRRNYEKA